MKKDYKHTINLLIVSIAILAVILLLTTLHITQTFGLDKSEIECIPPSPNELSNFYGDLSIQYSRAIDSDSIHANQLFNQGMINLFGFNRDEAQRSFEACLLIDSSCFCCLLGVILSNGATINNPIERHHFAHAATAIERADLLLSSKHSNLTKSFPEFLDLFQAQKVRFPPLELHEWNETVQLRFDTEYSTALLDVYLRHDNDQDLAVLYAESIINLTPWKYFIKRPFEPSIEIPTPEVGALRSTVGRYSTEDMTPAIDEAYRLINSVLSKQPSHLLALHLYIHLLEQTAEPEEALWAADQLASAVGASGTGHLVHMPAHIYARTGQYASAIASSIKAIQLDTHFAKHCLLPYAAGHNVNLLLTAALSCGAAPLALEYSTHSISNSSVDMGRFVTALFPTPLELLYCRFGLWSRMIELHKSEFSRFTRSGMTSAVAPSDELRLLSDIRLPDMVPYFDLLGLPVFHRVLYYYTDALAAIHLSAAGEAGSVTVLLEKLSTAVDALPASDFAASHVFYPYHREMGRLMNSTAHAAYLIRFNSDYDSAISLLQAGVHLQDSFSYMEPEHHYLPLRQCSALIHLQRARRTSESLEDASTSSDALERLLKQLAVDYTAAITLYRQDLVDHPLNAWSSTGLVQLHVALTDLNQSLARLPAPTLPSAPLLSLIEALHRIPSLYSAELVAAAQIAQSAPVGCSCYEVFGGNV